VVRCYLLADWQSLSRNPNSAELCSGMILAALKSLLLPAPGCLQSKAQFRISHARLQRCALLRIIRKFFKGTTPQLKQA
jgi:hypothetical protein